MFLPQFMIGAEQIYKLYLIHHTYLLQLIQLVEKF